MRGSKELSIKHSFRLLGFHRRNFKAEVTVINVTGDVLRQNAASVREVHIRSKNRTVVRALNSSALTINSINLLRYQTLLGA